MIRKIFAFFGGLKITAILGGALAIALGWIKIQGNTIDKQDDIIDGHEKEDGIIEDMGLSDIKIKKEKEDAIKSNDGSDYDDYI